MTTMASQITSLTVVYSTVYSDADQRKHQSSASLAFVWGIHRDRWIPRTNGQQRGKCFHLMTSSWSVFRGLSYRFQTNNFVCVFVCVCMMQNICKCIPCIFIKYKISDSDSAKGQVSMSTSWMGRVSDPKKTAFVISWMISTDIRFQF